MSTTVTPTTAPPQPVIVSYWLYLVGAVLGLVGAIVLLVVLPSTIAASSDATSKALQGQSTDGVDVSSAVAGITIGTTVLSVVVTLVFSVLTIVFARKYRQGKNWARVVLAVFAGLQLFGIAGAFGVGALHFLVVIAALVLSFLPSSNAWFRAVKPAPTTAV
jgi:predicted secreted protein